MITRTSMFTGIERTLDLDFTAEQLAEWKNGALIQDAMPNLSPADREFVMTGVTDEEWSDEFGDEETDSVHELKGNPDEGVNYFSSLEDVVRVRDQGWTFPFLGI